MPDVFISYTHPDNEYPGYHWVTCFYEALKKRLSIDRPGIDIMLDEDGGVRGADILDEKLKHALRNTGILIPIISPGYIQSGYCRNEVSWFSSGGDDRVSVPTKDGSPLTRILKVYKRPVEKGELEKFGFPAAIRTAMRNDFYEKYRGGANMELHPPDVSPTPSPHFALKLELLAVEILRVLKAIEEHALAEGPSPDPKAPVGTVYLAESTSDLNDSRLRIQAELQSAGYVVVPGAPFPHDSNYVDNVKSAIAQSRFSIHPVGKYYGPSPENLSESVVQIQYRIAGEQSAADPKFKRLSWMPPTVEPEDKRQEQFIKTLRDGDENLKVTSLVEFKSIVDAVLEQAKQRPTRTEVKGVYLIFEPQDDLKTGELVQEYLHKKHPGLSVVTFFSQKDLKAFMTKKSGALENHEDRLALSRGVVVCYGDAGKDWYEYIRLQLLRNFTSEKIGMKPSCVFLVDPEKDKKTILSDRTFEVVAAFGEDPKPEKLEDFIARVESSRGSA